MFFRKVDKKNERSSFLDFENEFVIDIRNKQERSNLLKTKSNNSFFCFLNKYFRKNLHFKFQTQDEKYEFNFLTTGEAKKISFNQLLKRYFIVNKYVLKQISSASLNELSIISTARFVFSICFNVGWIFLFFMRFILILLGVIYYKIVKLLHKASFSGIKIFANNFDNCSNRFFRVEYVKFKKINKKKNKRHSLNIIKKTIKLLKVFLMNVIYNVKSYVGFIKNKIISILLSLNMLFRVILSIPNKILSVFACLYLKVKYKFIFLTKSIQKRRHIIREKIINNKKIAQKEHYELKDVYYKKMFMPKTISSFIILMIIIVLPFQGLQLYNSFNIDGLKAKVVEASERAMSNFGSASESIAKMDVNGAVKNFSKADNNLLEAKQQIDGINDVILQLSRFVPKKEIQMASVGKKMLDLGITATKLGNDASLFFGSALKINNVFNSKSNVDMIEVFDNLEKQIVVVKNDLKQLKYDKSQINRDVLPDKYAKKFDDLSKKIDDFDLAVDKISEILTVSETFLGVKEDKKYLLVFQNTNEVRATGGFIGSIAVLDFDKGKLKSIEVPEGGSYDLDGGLKEFIVSPPPLQLVSSRWFFRDANWWPDWSKSAKKLMWFYEHSGGETVDGCISFTPNILKSILKIVGPIDMTAKYGVVINSDNFWDIIRTDIEINKKSNTPKTIIKDLFTKIIERFSKNIDANKTKEIIKSIQNSLDARDVLFYFNDNQLQNKVEENAWGGRIKKTNSDYLSVVNTNIAGGKSDKYIKQKIVHNVNIMANGSIIDDLTIYRHHTATSSNFSYYKTRNVDWIRVYVPKGSELIKASGFNAPDKIYFESPEQDWAHDKDLVKEENAIDKNGIKIYSDSGKTVFAGWSMVDAGDCAIIKLRYKLPFGFYIEKKNDTHNNVLDSVKNVIGYNRKHFFSYSLLVQQQAGSHNVEIEKKLNIPDFYHIKWSYPNEMPGNNLKFNGKLDKDQFWAILFSD